MFPTSLQKSIRELDRQISLLETECENMEKKKISTPPQNSLKFCNKSCNKPFITGPCFSPSSYATKTSTFSLVLPKSHSVSCSYFRKMSGNTLEDSCDNVKKSSGGPTTREFKVQESHKKITDSAVDYSAEVSAQLSRPNSTDKKELTVFKRTENRGDRDSYTNKSMGSIREVCETTDDNRACPLSMRKNSDTNLKGQIWVNQVNSDAWNDRTEESTDEPKECSKQKSNIMKPSSEGGSICDISNCFLKNRPASKKQSLEDESSPSPRHKIFTKRRPRSVRTKKNNASEISTGADFSRSLEEKEIQCMLFNEESDKAEFLADENNSIKTLQILIGDLKAKSSEERKKNVLSDMQKTLEKISSFKSINAINAPLTTMAYLNGRNVMLLETDENVVDLRKILLGVKLYCQELSDEKQAIQQKLSAKNRTIEGLKSNEKEYLSLISSLKYNLEKLKEEAEEGARAIKDLKIVKNKLQEETKVIEALKRSHGKMQYLIESYVLENDKLRAQMKMAKFESHKFSVLLSGKEAEIYKYKKEIESFQKQITEQLSLLRAKASENQVEHTINVIKKQSIFQTEVDSCPSETTIEKEFNENLQGVSKSLESVLSGIRNDNKCKEKTLFTMPPVQVETEPDSGQPSDTVRETGDSVKDAGFTSCKSDESEASDQERKRRTRRKKGNSENVNLQGMLTDMRINSAMNFWPLARNFSNSTQCSSLSNTTENDTPL